MSYLKIALVMESIPFCDNKIHYCCKYTSFFSSVWNAQTRKLQKTKRDGSSTLFLKNITVLSVTFNFFLKKPLLLSH